MDVARLAKTQATSAWIGAALLLFFGFVYMTEPTGTDLFSKAAWVFYQTLRIGGIAMAASAAFLMTGQVLSLAVDAFVAVTVGLLLIASGVVMFLDGGDMVQSLINVICGAGFASSGRRSWSAFSMSASDRSSLTPRPLNSSHPSDPSTSSNPSHPSHSSNSSHSSDPSHSSHRPANALPPLPRGDRGGGSEASPDPLRTSNFELPSSPPEAADYLSALAEKRRKDRSQPPP